MDVVWDATEPVTVRYVLGALEGERALAYTTVMTILDRLTQKSHVRRERSGRAYVYEASAPREAYTARLMAEALSTAADRDEALLHFVGRISKADVALLRKALDGSGRRR